MSITDSYGDEFVEASTSISVDQLSKSSHQFEFREIQSATKNFHESLVIGCGGFGKVYKGTFSNGSTHFHAAIKRLDPMSNQGEAEFSAEIEILSRLRHCHLVSLIGVCRHEKEMILVYEYMPNGTLENHLHKTGTPISWVRRLKICIGAARGLDYLHTGTGIDSGVIHRDVKSSNILLHESWAPKISDFGLSRVGPINQPLTYVNTLVKGTFGYLDPDYFYTGRLTRKSDVYSFGVVLLEVLCRKRAVDSSLDEEQWNLARWAQESTKTGDLKHIVDSGVRAEIFQKCLKEFVQIAYRCLHTSPKQRPTMAEVVAGLESVLNLQEKVNGSLQPVGRTIFGRMADKFSFRPNEDIPGMMAGNVPFYSYKLIKKATSGFTPERILATGSRATVYAGKINSEWLAIKTITDDSTYGEEKTLNEVKLMSCVSHPNVISLLGYCIERGKLILVYEFMPNGTLFQHLQKERGGGITWIVRLIIAKEIAEAIAYLHSDMNPPIYHRGIDSSNVLLDYNYSAKLAGFGDSILGSVDPPHFHEKFDLLAKSDVYAFGVVLMEIVTARKAVDQVNLADLAIEKIQNGGLDAIIDPYLERTRDALASIYKVAELGVRCLAYNAEMRPSMAEVANELRQIYVKWKGKKP